MSITTSQVPRDQTYVATVDAAGRATITIRSGSSYPWLVSQVSVEMLTAPAGATCELRKRGALISPMIAAADAAGGDPPVILYPGDEMTVQWAGATPGDQGKAYVVYTPVAYG